MEPSRVNTAMLNCLTVIDRNVASGTVYCLCLSVYNDA